MGAKGKTIYCGTLTKSTTSRSHKTVWIYATMTQCVRLWSTTRVTRLSVSYHPHAQKTTLFSPKPFGKCRSTSRTLPRSCTMKSVICECVKYIYFVRRVIHLGHHL